MKRFLAISLLVVMLVSCLFLTSCARKVKNIDGQTPKEAYEKAVTSLETIDKYTVKLSIDSRTQLLFIPIYKITLNDFYTYAYDGNNQHFYIAEETLELAESDPDIADILYGYDENVIYYNNVCYVNNSGYKYKYESSYLPYGDSEYEEMVKDLIDSGVGKYKCYKKGDFYYFEITNKDEDEMLMDGAQEEITTVYFNEDGLIETIIIESKYSPLVKVTIRADYSYGEDAEDVLPPSDIENYPTR